MVAIVNVCVCYQLSENIWSAAGVSVAGFDVDSSACVFWDVVMQLSSHDRGDNKAFAKVYNNGRVIVMSKNRHVADATIAALASSLSEAAGINTNDSGERGRGHRVLEAKTKVLRVTGVVKRLRAEGAIPGWMMAAFGSEPQMRGNAAAAYTVYTTPLGHVNVHGTKAIISGRDEDAVGALGRLIRYGHV